MSDGIREGKKVKGRKGRERNENKEKTAEKGKDESGKTDKE